MAFLIYLPECILIRRQWYWNLLKIAESFENSTLFWAQHLAEDQITFLETHFWTTSSQTFCFHPVNIHSMHFFASSPSRLSSFSLYTFSSGTLHQGNLRAWVCCERERGRERQKGRKESSKVEKKIWLDLSTNVLKYMLLFKMSFWLIFWVEFIYPQNYILLNFGKQKYML